MSSVTLGNYASWIDVLRALDCHVPRPSLPCRVTCPLCHGTRLTIYDDSISGGQWHYCPNCYSFGDLLDLAGRAWKLDAVAAARRLNAFSIPYPDHLFSDGAVSHYRRFGSDRRERLAALWTAAREHLAQPNYPELSGLREHYRLHTRLSPEAWRSGPGRFLGALPAKAIHHSLTKTGITKIPSGCSQAESLLVPHYSLPGQLCGFAAAGRRGAPDERAFYPFLDAPRHQKHEGGLSSLELAESGRSVYGPYAVAIGDPFLASRIHVRHAQLSLRPLPLIAYTDTPNALTRTAWTSLYDVMPVLWGFGITASLVFQAIAANGLLAWADLRSPSRIDHYLRDCEPVDVVRRAIQAAKPWRESLRRWSESVNSSEVQTLVSNLDVYGVDPETLAGIAAPFEDCAKIRGRDRRIRFRNATVIERDDQWFKLTSDHRLERIANGVLRIDGTRRHESRTQPGVEHVSYTGSLLFAGTVTTFEIAVKALRRDPLGCLTEVASRSNPNSAFWIDPRWRSQFLDIALQFSPRACV